MMHAFRYTTIMFLSALGKELRGSYTKVMIYAICDSYIGKLCGWNFSK